MGLRQDGAPGSARPTDTLLDPVEVPGLRELLTFAEADGISGNLWQAWLTAGLLRDENPWSLACEGRGEPEGSLRFLVSGELARLFERFRNPPSGLAWEILHYRPSAPATPAGQRVMFLRDALAETQNAADFQAAAAAEGFRKLGAGELALHHAFRAGRGGKLHPIPGVQTGPLSALVGYEHQKKLLTENVAAFLAGRQSNHMLLYGDAGTGKSTCVRALLTEFADSPLRLVELQRSAFPVLPALLARLRRRQLRFLLFIDDLSFEENETEYKYLKAAIEGGLETMPDCVRLCATSNRRHLIRETWADRSDMEHDGELHRSDTVEEKLSLAGRFGLTIRFDSPGRRLYYDIVDRLAAEQGLSLPPERLHVLADAWEIRHGGPTGRTAKQFIDDLAGKRSG
ncbi:MAG: DUF815 domain-containing protein [Oscillospiraceae bacterium]|nr:DUF815 domain-containing protein [Oscillospiraceae bacterium]